MKISRFGWQSAFSLVEVTLALGLATFCLLALVGLLPVGLGTVKLSREEAAAINCMKQISESIRSAVPQTNSSNYQALGAYRTLTWSFAGQEVTSTLTNLSISGFPVSGADDPMRFAARIRVKPPTNVHTTGTAYISVAWPVQATWDAARSEWQNAQGSVHTCLIFLPHP